MTEGTWHTAELIAIKAALDRMKKPADIAVHTADVYVLTYLDMIDELAEGGFRKADGAPIHNKDLWEKVWELSQPHNLTVLVGSHQYSGWIRMELKHRFGTEQDETA